MRFYMFLSAVLIFMIPAIARADDDSLKLPPPGTTVMNLNATETQKVPQDLLTASLRIEADDRDAKAVQSKINAAMQKALDMTKAVTSVKTQTGGYSVYQYDPAPAPAPDAVAARKRMVWKGSQTIKMQSKDPDALLKLAGQLQDSGFVMNNLAYTLSPEKYESVQDELLTRALGKLTAKADLAAKTLKKSGYDMLNVDLNPSGQVTPMPMYARAEMGGMAMKSMAAPVAQAGDSDVSLTVSARVLLKP